MEWKNNIGVYLETSDGRLTSLSVELLGKARQLADARPNQVLGILAGDNLEAAAQEAIAYGADGVALLQAPALASFDAALYTEAVAKALSLHTPSVLFIGASPNGRDLGGRLSARLDAGLVADCTDVRYEGEDDTLTWIRPAYTGKLFVKIQTTTRPQLGTVSDKIFHGNPKDESRQGEIFPVSLEGVTGDAAVKMLDFTSLEQLKDVLDLDTADLVVGAGRGVQNEEGMREVQSFAKRIGAGFGVSKPLVDAGWVPYEWQVGVTGKKIAPKIYIALGISGAIQHKLGIQEAGLIIAVNKSPDAPIFQFAHYGIVGDLFDVMPELEKLLKKD